MTKDYGVTRTDPVATPLQYNRILVTHNIFHNLNSYLKYFLSILSPMNRLFHSIFPSLLPPPSTSALY